MLPLLVIVALAAGCAAIVLGGSAAMMPAAWPHVAFALGIMPLILAAMAYFVPVLTRSAAAPPAMRLPPLVALAAGVLAVYALAAAQRSPLILTAAAVAALAAVSALLVWIMRRALTALGPPHAGLRWYLAACGFLAAGLLAVAAMAVWPGQYVPLRLLHLHLNTLGFVGLTAIGTLQVLLPTAAGRPDHGAALRLARDLWWSVGGAALVALGAAWFRPLSYVGLTLYLLPLVRLGRAWWRDFRPQILRRDGTTSSLALALLGFLLVLAAGAVHGLGWLVGRDTTAAFIAAFLLPLVSGAAAQLLPVWLRPGMQTAWHQSLRLDLGRWSLLRAGLMITGGVLMALGATNGVWPAGAGLVILMAAIGQAVWRLRLSHS
jgi:hypothetical protein